MLNAFDLLGLPASYDLEPQALEQAYFDAQRRLHPDRFIGKPESARLQAAQEAADINTAYTTLRQPLTRAAHLLALHGIHVNTDHDTLRPSPALLMDMLERREALDALTTPEELHAAHAAVRQDIAHTEAAIRAGFAQPDLPATAQATLRLRYLHALEDAIQARLVPSRAHAGL